MKKYESWAQGFRYYKQLKAMVVLNDYGSWVESSRCYAQLNIVDNLNDSGSRELKPLDTMNNLGLRIIWMIPCDKLGVVDDINDFKSWA